MTRYLPARHYLWFAIAALSLSALLLWWAMAWNPRTWAAIVLTFLPAALFGLTASLLLVLAFRPPIEIHDGYLAIGRRVIPWMDIRRLDRTRWIAPLVVRITLFDDSRHLLLYTGNLDSCNALLGQLRRASRDALIDGVPYRQYWGEVLAPVVEAAQAMPPRYRLLRPEDEAEVERLYQRLKTVGNLDQKNSADEN
jgi:hypothetical protein